MRLQSIVLGAQRDHLSSHLPERKLGDRKDLPIPLQPIDVKGRYAHPFPLGAWPGDKRSLHGCAAICQKSLEGSLDVSDLRSAGRTTANSAHVAEVTAQRECFSRARPAQIAPIQTLPNELLSEIFRHVLQNSPARGVRPHPRDPVVILTAVCSRWRAVAAADRRLWTSIDASYSRTQPANPLTTRRIIAYSANLPLDLRLWLPSHTGALADAHAILCAHHRRWRCVDADVFRFGAFLEAHGATGGMPMLEHLCVHNSHTEKEELAYILPAPRLRSVALHSPFPFVCSYATPWGQLTAYSGPVVVDGVSVLHRLANVETCELVGQVVDDAHGEPIELPHLRALRVSHTAHLRLLVAPGLEVLEVPNEAQSLPAIASFLDRSRCSSSGDCSSLSELRCSVDMLPKLPSLLLLAPTLKTLGVSLDPSDGERLLSSIRACKEALAKAEGIEFRPTGKSNCGAGNFKGHAGNTKVGASLEALLDGLADVSLAALQRVRVYGCDTERDEQHISGLQVEYHRARNDSVFMHY
ncbi:uncharacterized protein SCHCODRAFT_02491071 [Schizophyllum commune H4-8]|uniref:uncharacterized protein n=1 Tax=Schizophyllum commune (strain H4-8 / FGSC 9210) TaxID=578458 RepID=UPI002160E1DB|nr:uncharacterized protein SCHCODRAFT_02491071 [Schizophyllum commune H4-8]KAI5896094.1 hypothetical protein SCHCODRAFT_02491071 [Schizophyllum commune H4-8]